MKENDNSDQNHFLDSKSNGQILSPPTKTYENGAEEGKENKYKFLHHESVLSLTVGELSEFFDEYKRLLSDNTTLLQENKSLKQRLKQATDLWTWQQSRGTSFL